MKPLRVLLITNDAALGQAAAYALEGSPEVEFVSVQRAGHLAMTRIALEAPDTILVDAAQEPAIRDQVLSDLRDLFPTLPVVLLSESALDSMRGAVESTEGEMLPVTSLAELRAQPSHLRGQVHDTHGTRKDGGERPRENASFPKSRDPFGKAGGHPPTRVVAIGASTGGPEAIGALLGDLKSDLPVPIVVALHMPKHLTIRIVDRLITQTPLQILVADCTRQLEPGVVYVAPGDRHMVVSNSTDGPEARPEDDAPVNGHRPSVDRLFESVARCFGDSAMALILTGLGEDGLLGAQAISKAGGRVLAQSESSAVNWGMPGAIVRAGLAETYGSPRVLALHVRRSTRDRKRRGKA